MGLKKATMLGTINAPDAYYKILNVRGDPKGIMSVNYGMWSDKASRDADDPFLTRGTAADLDLSEEPGGPGNKPLLNMLYPLLKARPEFAGAADVLD